MLFFRHLRIRLHAASARNTPTIGANASCRAASPSAEHGAARLPEWGKPKTGQAWPDHLRDIPRSQFDDDPAQGHPRQVDGE